MEVVARSRRAPGRAARQANQMRVVDAENPLAIRIVQRQRVGDPVRPSRVDRDAMHRELDPIALADFG